MVRSINKLDDKVVVQFTLEISDWPRQRNVGEMEVVNCSVIERSGENVHQIFNATFPVISVIDKDGDQIFDVNPAFGELCGAYNALIRMSRLR